MKTPVLIAARNEAEYIGATLSRLDAASVEPYVIVNDTQDATADIARSFGATVYEREEPGKIPALQYGLRQLNKRALDDVLYLDADTEPQFPKHWSQSMIYGLGTEARVGSGLFISSDGPLFQKHVMSALRLANQLKKVMSHEPLISGANMITRIGDSERLEALLSLENYGLDEDVARTEAIAGPTEIRSILHPYALVRTSSRYLGSPITLLLKGRKGALEAVHADRSSRLIDEPKPYIRP